MLHQLMLFACMGSCCAMQADGRAAGPACAGDVPDQRVLACRNRSHYTYRDCDSGQLDDVFSAPCAEGWTCEPSTGSCAAPDLATHLLRSVDYQIVETVVASEASNCSLNPNVDAAQGRMLCEVLHGTAVAQPTFGHSLGNTWETCPPSQHGSIDGCNFTTAEGWRKCIGANVGKQAALLSARSPHLLFSAGLMEFLHRNNLDHPEEFEARCCQKGSIGQWGSKETCVPDVTSSCIQAYYTSWGQAYMDGGVRAFFFGQSRLTGRGRACNSDGTGVSNTRSAAHTLADCELTRMRSSMVHSVACTSAALQCSRVSSSGAEGFATVLNNLKAYAKMKGYGRVYFGPQAASGFELANGTELADWTYGAQHLYASGDWLVSTPARPC